MRDAHGCKRARIFVCECAEWCGVVRCGHVCGVVCRIIMGCAVRCVNMSVCVYAVVCIITNKTMLGDVHGWSVCMFMSVYVRVCAE